MTDHAHPFKRLSAAEALRALYVDFEGQKGEPLTEDEYHAAAEATLGPCGCGGRFRYDAPARCPECRSTPEQWDVDPKVGRSFYD